MKKLTAIILLFLVILPGCGKNSPIRDKGFTSSKQSEVAAMDASVLSVIPWEEIQDELQPEFAINSTKALNEAIPATLNEERKILNSLDAYLKVALAGKLTTLKTTTTKATDAQTTVDEVREEALTQPDLSSLSVNDGSLPSHDAGAQATSGQVNPRLLYSAATAFYQEIRLLNKYVKYASQKKDYTPYLVRMQVSLTPMADDARYDAYSTISFFPDRFTGATFPEKMKASFNGKGLFHGDGVFKGEGLFQGRGVFDGQGKFTKEDDGSVHNTGNTTSIFSGTGKFNGNCTFTGTGEFQGTGSFTGDGSFNGDTPPAIDPKAPYVVPLLVSEDLERSSFGRINDDIIRMGMAIQATINGLGLETGIENTLQDLLKLSGNDYNSLMTVGRISDNSIRVRFGAMQTASKTGSEKIRVMVPRTHYVTLLLMVPGSKAPDYDKLLAVTRTTLVNYVTGKPLEGKNHTQIIQGIRGLLAKYGIKSPRRIETDETEDVELITDAFRMARAVQTNRWESFQIYFDQLCKDLDSENKTDICSRVVDGLREQVWTDMADLWVGGQYSYTSFEVPSKTESIPKKLSIPTGLSFIAVDDGSTTTVRIAGGRNLRKDEISPILDVTAASGTYRLAADSLTVNDDGRGCKIQFMSFNSTKSNPKKLKIRLQDKGKWHNIIYFPPQKKEAKQTAENFSASSSMTYIAAENGAGVLQVSFSGVGENSVMKIENAAILSTYLSQAGFRAASSLAGWYKIPGNGLFDIKLSDMKKGVAVKVSAGTSEDGKAPVNATVMSAIPYTITSTSADKSTTPDTDKSESE
ncbi:hypothetical protein [Maridesulfovibrio sp.]|uniref:hypothetical protein n=1 Tax=Maridesulfovibrio sp. TaxID=2795000 RepID=UPI002A187225|nr:hypothetical protein [Maridesulfovibrio sp.]